MRNNYPALDTDLTDLRAGDTVLLRHVRQLDWTMRATVALNQLPDKPYATVSPHEYLAVPDNWRIEKKL